MAAKSGQLKVKDQPFEIQSNSKYSIILGKRIKSVKIAHRHMLTCSFADDQEGLGGWKREVHLWYFLHLFYTSGDSVSYTWRVWRCISEGALESAWICCFNGLCESWVCTCARAVCSEGISITLILFRRFEQNNFQTFPSTQSASFKSTQSLGILWLCGFPLVLLENHGLKNKLKVFASVEVYFCSNLKMLPLKCFLLKFKKSCIVL